MEIEKQNIVKIEIRKQESERYSSENANRKFTHRKTDIGKVHNGQL